MMEVGWKMMKVGRKMVGHEKMLMERISRHSVYG